MNEIIERLTSQAGLSNEQATKALETIVGYVKEKFPMLSGAVDNMFGGKGAEEPSGLNMFGE